MKEHMETQHLALSPSSSDGLKGKSLFFKVLTERSIRSKSIEQVFQKVWVGDGRLQVKLVAEGIWMAIFDYQADMERVLENGPWHFNGDLVLVAAGSTTTKPSEIDFSTFKLWVHFSDLPLELCSEQCLHVMAEKLGKVIKVECVANKEAFANRALVEFTVGIPFCKQVKVTLPDDRVITIPLSYEKLPRFCTYCGRPCHAFKACSIARVLRKQIERISDERKREELLANLKPKYDNSLFYKKFSGSLGNKSNGSESSEIPHYNASRSSSESFSSSPMVPLIRRSFNRLKHSGVSNEEVTSPVALIPAVEPSNLDDNVQHPKAQKELAPQLICGGKEVYSDCKVPISLATVGKIKLEVGCTSVRKWKKLIREGSKDSSIELIEKSDEIAQIKGLQIVSPQVKKKRKKQSSPKSPTPAQKLKKAVGSSPLPNNQ